MLRTNQNKLVEMSIQGKPANPMSRGLMIPDHEGVPFALPGTGGITYNVKIGDSAFGWVGDHIEPGVSTVADEKERNAPLNAGYNFYSCIGNEAIVVSGGAKGKRGTVTGKHGGAEHVLIDFPDEAFNKMTLDDKILIRAMGQGLALTDYPKISIYNMDPKLFAKMKIRAGKKKSIMVPVTHTVPGHLMGSGVGSIRPHMGDYDIMTQDAAAVKKHGLESMRFGDIVALLDHDNTFGRCWRKGAITIGVVVHSDCKLSGHGPGVVSLLSSSKALIEPVMDKNANIGQYLKIGKYRTSGRKKRK